MSLRHGDGDVIEIEDDNSDGGGAGDGCPEEAAPAASTEAPPQPPAAEAGEAEDVLQSAGRVPGAPPRRRGRGAAAGAASATGLSSIFHENTVYFGDYLIAYREDKHCYWAKCHLHSGRDDKGKMNLCLAACDWLLAELIVACRVDSLEWITDTTMTV